MSDKDELDLVWESHHAVNAKLRKTRYDLSVAQAEIKRLKHDLEIAKNDAKSAGNVMELALEREKKVIAELERLKAVIEHDGGEHSLSSHCACVPGLEAEVERLRSAIKNILNWEITLNGGAISAVEKIARNILEGEK